MATEIRRRAGDCPPHRSRVAYGRPLLVERVTPCAPLCVIRPFAVPPLTLAFHISNRRESCDGLAYPGQLSSCDYLINILISATCFFGETCP